MLGFNICQVAGFLLSRHRPWMVNIRRIRPDADVEMGLLQKSWCEHNPPGRASKFGMPKVHRQFIGASLLLDGQPERKGKKHMFDRQRQSQNQPAQWFSVLSISCWWWQGAYGEFVGVETFQPLVTISGILSIGLIGMELVIGSTTTVALVT